MTVTVHRLKVMFLNAAGSEIRNLISVPRLFSGEKLFPTMGLEGGIWEPRVGESGRQRECVRRGNARGRWILNRDVLLPT